MNQEELERIATLVAEKVLKELKVDFKIGAQSQQASPMLSAQDTARYLGLAVSTVYKYSHGRIIPYYKPNGRDIFFKQSDLDSFLESKRYSSKEEIEARADDYLVNR